MKKVLAAIGDVNPIDYGGGFVFQEKTARGDYSQWIEYTDGLEGAEDTPLQVYRVDLPAQPVGLYYDWVDWDAVASTVGADPEALRELAWRNDSQSKTEALELIASHYGWYELDQYPLQLPEGQLKRRWRAALRRK